MNSDTTYEEGLNELLSTGIFVIEKLDDSFVPGWLYLKIIDSDLFLTIANEGRQISIIGWRNDRGLKRLNLETVCTMASKETFEKIIFNFDIFMACEKMKVKY